MEFEPGLRVVRGPDWKWDDQDGGEGCLGTVAESPAGGIISQAMEGVVVQWDAGNRCNYRCGIDGKYDLRVYDSAPAGVSHPGVICDSCHRRNIPGIRWKCTSCYDYDLCTPCYFAGKHHLDHKFWRMDKGRTHQGVRLAPRESSRKILARGFFPDAQVVRGHDWLWGDQDGGLGCSGVIKTLKDHSDTSRSIVEVEWGGSGKANIYRAGHGGKVDVRCVTVGVGSHFYPDHLPVLGASAPLEDTHQSAPELASPVSPTASKFKPGDRVKVQLEVEVFRLMQEGHGGWNDRMAEVLSETGTVHTVLESGDLRVRYPSNRVWTMNPETLSILKDEKAKQFSVGDAVRVLDDIAKVHDLQEDHGGWVDDIALSLGQVGRVSKVFPTGDVRVAVNGRMWTMNPACLVPAPGENPPDVPDSPEVDFDIHTQLKVLSLMGSPATVVAAAAARDADALKDYLSSNPQHVNAKAAGKAALHCATAAGDVAVVKAILEFNPDLEIEDEDGDRPLHICAYCDEDEIAKLLIDRGANINPLNGKGATPLIIAAVKGHHSVLRILANHPSAQLHEQDTDGDTALHCAVLAQKNESVSILLKAGADPTRVNFRLFTPIHEAARIGFLPAIEQFARAKCDLNVKKDDGFTPIHLAALNDHLDVTTALADLNSCNINGVTNMGQTALHLAVHQGHTRIVERLVGYGIDLNLQDSDGDTALHVALMRKTADALSAETPQLKKVRESFGRPGDVGPHAVVTVACFLIQEGADISLRNKKGHTPVQACTPEVISLVIDFKDSLTLRNPRSFHGSLRSPTVTSPTSPMTVFAIGGGGSSDGLSVGSPAVAAPPQPVMTQRQPPFTGQQQPSEPVDTGGTSSSNVEDCFLCDAPVDVQFEPCGHAMMCSTCAQRAKKCPQCKAVVKILSKLKPMCPMCKEEEVSVTMRPCGHKFCPGCARRMKVCFDCRNNITSKEGLPPETKNAGSAESGVSNKCAICLTEPRNTALLCGHQLCWDCAQRVDHCPVCRKFVTHRIRLF